ncbi:SDR family oxidoreductase [Streptomyces sp. L7]
MPRARSPAASSLTGATGFVGTHLLAQLLLRHGGRDRLHSAGARPGRGNCPHPQGP